jgi:hypothetical protein
MREQDKFHDRVKQALVSDRWTVADEPLKVVAFEEFLDQDFGASPLILAERGLERIAVAVNSFFSAAPIEDFHQAVGEIFAYRLVLEIQDPDRPIYLAIPADIYSSFFQLEFIRGAIEEFRIPLIVYDPVGGVIIEWRSIEGLVEGGDSEGSTV